MWVPWPMETALQADGRHGATAVRIAQFKPTGSGLLVFFKIDIYCIQLYIYICLYWEKYHLISIYPDEHYIYIPMYIHLCVYVYTVLRSSHSYPTKIWSHIDLIPKRWWLYRGVFCQCFRFKILSQVILFRLVQAYLPNLVDFFFRSEHCCLPRGVRIFYPKRFDVLRC